ncbi:hypothetical protein [Brevibacillus sp. 179-C9.3 HS]|uniref:hypothetical protein n=1 Tax=unclassified Brevibacillus TaxID=2684853 RepID=UPI0039A2909D
MASDYVYFKSYSIDEDGYLAFHEDSSDQFSIGHDTAASLIAILRTVVPDFYIPAIDPYECEGFLNPDGQIKNLITPSTLLKASQMAISLLDQIENPLDGVDSEPIFDINHFFGFSIEKQKERLIYALNKIRELSNEGYFIIHLKD